MPPDRMETKHRKRIGVMGGSFNPVHSGHLMVASFIRQKCGLDEVWLSLSPVSPFKSDLRQAGDKERFEMLKIALCGADGLCAIDTELTLSRPSYTLNLLDCLAGKYPDCDFSLIIGSDNWLAFDKWHAPGEILQRYGVIVYPRPGYKVDDKSDPHAVFVKAPGIDISSSFIRSAIAGGLNMAYYLPQAVNEYITEHNLYKNEPAGQVPNVGNDGK